MTKIDRSSLLEALNAGGAAWRSFYDKHDLSNSEQVVFELDCSKLIIQEAYLVAVAFRDSLFLCTDMSYSQCNGADLRGGIFNNANLSGAIFRSATMNGSSFINAQMLKANFERATLDESNFEGANLFGARLGGATLTHANLTKANFTRADLRKAHLTGANLQGGNFTNANLAFASFDITDSVRIAARANNEQEDLPNPINNITIVGANFTNADLRGTGLQRKNLKYSITDGAKFDKTPPSLSRLSPEDRAVKIVALNNLALAVRAEMAFKPERFNDHRITQWVDACEGIESILRKRK